MAKLTGIGAPSRKTKGAVGDIYIDKNTGIEYTCTFAYKSGDEEEFECDWKKSINKEKAQTASVYGEIKNKDEAKVDTDSVKKVEGIKEPQKEPEVTDKNEESNSVVEPETPKRMDYSSYSKKTNNPR